ncbi:hypothetical protein V1281_005705 [Nitrobacteraceae bacterium AZCC 2161]
MNATSPILPALILPRRNRFIEGIEQQILNIGLFQEGALVSHKHFWIDESAAIYFQLYFFDQRVELKNGDDILEASTFDDLVEQLDQIKIIAGGLDDALAACESVVKPHSCG